MSFAHLLRKSGDQGKYSPDGADAHDAGGDTGEQRVKGDEDLDVKVGKHQAAHAMVQAMKEGDHEALSGALEDWHALHAGTGAEAAKRPEDTRMSKDESKYSDPHDDDDR